MSEADTETYPEVVARRVDLADLNVIGEWLIRRIQERHPAATPQQILGWLRGCIPSTAHFFVRSDHAVALAELRREPLNPYPDGWEIFVFAESEDWRPEAAELYRRMGSWAANADATNLHTDIWTDVSRAMIQTRLGKLASRTHAVALLWVER